jgi:hypothetical protein
MGTPALSTSGLNRHDDQSRERRKLNHQDARDAKKIKATDPARGRPSLFERPRLDTGGCILA